MSESDELTRKSRHAGHSIHSFLSAISLQSRLSLSSGESRFAIGSRRSIDIGSIGTRSSGHARFSGVSRSSILTIESRSTVHASVTLETRKTGSASVANLSGATRHTINSRITLNEK